MPSPSERRTSAVLQAQLAVRSGMGSHLSPPKYGCKPSAAAAACPASARRLHFEVKPATHDVDRSQPKSPSGAAAGGGGGAARHGAAAAPSTLRPAATPCVCLTACLGSPLRRDGPDGARLKHAGAGVLLWGSGPGALQPCRCETHACHSTPHLLPPLCVQDIAKAHGNEESRYRAQAHRKDAQTGMDWCAGHSRGVAGVGAASARCHARCWLRAARLPCPHAWAPWQIGMHTRAAP